MHVLIIPTEEILINDKPLFGIFQKDQAEVLKAAGHKIGILSAHILGGRLCFQPKRYKKYEQYSGISIVRRYERHIIPDHRISNEQIIDRYAKLGLKCFELYKDIHGVPDIIHAHNIRHAGFVAKAISQVHGIPFYITEHSSEYERNCYATSRIPVLKSCVKAARGFSTVSKNAAHSLKELLGDIKVEVLHNIVHIPFDKWNKTPKINDETIVFLSIGALVTLKNHELLIRAFASKFKGKNAILKIGGVGPLSAYLNEIASELGVQSQVLFLGYLDREQVVQEMTFADVFVLPSDFETFGVVLIEAMACGTPLIATDCGGPADIIDITNGIIVPQKDLHKLADALVKTSSSLAQYDPGFLRRSAIERFGPQAYLKRLSEFYGIDVVAANN